MPVVSLHFSIITLNVNELNSPMKRHRVAESIEKNPVIYSLQKTHFRIRDTHQLKVKGWEKEFRANGNPKKAEVAILYQTKKI